MRDYGKVFSRLWGNKRFRGLDRNGKLFYLYLLTAGDGNPVGLFKLPSAFKPDAGGRWLHEDTGLDPAEWSAAIKACEAADLASFDPATETVFVHRFINKEGLANHNVIKKCIKELTQLSSGTPFYKKLLDEIYSLDEIPPHYADLITFIERLDEPFNLQAQNSSGNGIANPIPIPLPTPAPNPEPNPNPEKASPAQGAGTAEAAGDPKPPASPTPPPQPAKPQHPSIATWEAYSAAYAKRYGVMPIRDAATNAQLLKLVSKLGAEAAPQVAAFYLSHKGARYVAAMHPPGMLLLDAGKLHTEWLTKRQMTSAEARQTDATASRGSVFNDLVQEARDGIRRS